MVLSRRSGSSSGTNTVGSRPQKIIREKERERERERTLVSQLDSADLLC